MAKMEIENENNSAQEPIPNPQASSSLSTLSNSQLQYLSQILGIKINQDEISFFSSIEDLASFINTIKFPDKKKNETKDSLIDDLKSLKSEDSLNKFKEEKSKKFSEIVKSNGKTTTFHTAEKDELSPTMHAFYFCDKSKQILSDKDAAEFKNMTFDPVYPSNFLKDNEDNSSQNSCFIDPLALNNKNVLGRRRKGSNAMNNAKSIKRRKTEKGSEELISNKNEDDSPEEEYCIVKCRFGRKQRNQSMIQCDNCNTWYHNRCLGISDEFVQKNYTQSEKKWFCPKCKDSDIDSKKNSEETD